MMKNNKRAKRPEKITPQDFAGICGLYWEGNAWYDMLEASCGTQEDADVGKICPVYACAQQRGVAHCGACPEFPCVLLVNLAAQSGSEDPRIESAEVRATWGDDRWAEWARPRAMWRKAFCPLRGGPTHT